MRPLLIFSRWLMQRRKVVLPEPLGPMMTTTSPLRTCIFMPRSTSLLWKYLCTSRASTIGRPLAPFLYAAPLPGAGCGCPMPGVFCCIVVFPSPVRFSVYHRAPALESRGLLSLILPSPLRAENHLMLPSVAQQFRHDIRANRLRLACPDTESALPPGCSTQ